MLVSSAVFVLLLGKQLESDSASSALNIGFIDFQLLLDVWWGPFCMTPPVACSSADLKFFSGQRQTYSESHGDM